LYCSAHGSTFDLQGNVTHEPASRPLKQYRTEKVNNEIIIYLQS
jgi:cytochrome b6-f complex iron-sulfur subunit